MLGTDGKQREDGDTWTLVDYDPMCMAFHVMREQIKDTVATSTSAKKITEGLAMLQRQLRECVYDRLERGSGVPKVSRAKT
jgi:hypothetical protein